LTAGDGTAASPTWTEVDTHDKTVELEPVVARTPGRLSGARWWFPGPSRALIVVTLANYVWQVPYVLHFSAHTGRAPSGLVVPLALTLMWFLLATLLLPGRRPGGVVVMSVYLVTEAGFYLLHNLSGARGRDLSATDPILLIGSVLGYLNALAAIGFLAWLRCHRTQAREVTAPVGVSAL
jgi:hypothetical protein